jgi:hypothetical protein
MSALNPRRAHRVLPIAVTQPRCTVKTRRLLMTLQRISLVRRSGIAAVGAIVLSAAALSAPAQAKIPHLNLKVSDDKAGIQQVRFRGHRGHRGHRRWHRGHRRWHRGHRRWHRWHHRHRHWGRWHRRHWRYWRFRRYRYAFGYPRYAPCRWLLRRARITGSRYWWRRYRHCVRRFY